MKELLISLLVVPGDIVILVVVILLLLAGLNRRKYKSYQLDPEHIPGISLIVPAHNEESVIGRTIEAFLDVDYPNKYTELIVVNDGSKDSTAKIVESYAGIIIDDQTQEKVLNSNGHPNVTLINRNNGGHGKAQASNIGGYAAKHEILFFVDADVAIDKSSFRQAARHFVDPKVSALAGFVIINTNKSALNGFLRFESVMAQKVMRAGFNVLGIHYIVPGGCAIFRSELWKEVKGYTVNSLAEDTDLTWKILTETDQQIRFDSSIKVYADEPQAMSALWNQRVRWSRGNIEVTKRHGHKIGRAKYGKAATYLYIFWIAIVFVPVTFVLTTVGVLLAILLSANTSFIIAVTSIIGLSFFFNWIVGLIANRGSGGLEGLISPGLPMLLIFVMGLTLTQYNIFFGLDNINQYLQVLAKYMLVTVLVSYVGTYLMVFLSKSRYKLVSKSAEIIQLIVLGYWMLILASAIEGYVRELLGVERKWIRTIR